LNTMITNLLLVEDNPVNVEYIRALLLNIENDSLEQNRFIGNIFVALTLKEGIETLNSKNIDIVLLDLTLPDSHGLKTFQVVQNVNDRVPIIVLTGDDDTALAFDAIHQGAQDYLVKGKINKTLLQRSIHYAVERMNILKALLDSQERYSIALKATNDGIWEWNLREKKMYFSPRWKEIIGYAENELGSEPLEWFDRIHPEDVPEVEGIIADHISGQTRNLVSEHRLLHRNGTYLWVRVHGLAVLDKEGSVKKIAGALSDITGEKLIDSLTGLPNISLFSDRLQSAIQRRIDEKDFGFVLIKLEFEQVKIITTTYGAAATNEAIYSVVTRIKTCLKASDTIGRFEGASFGIILAGVHDILNLNHILDNIQIHASKPFLLNGNSISISTSMGIVFSGDQYKISEEMIRDADAALQKAMSNGRSNREVFESEMRDRSLRILKMEADMRHAIERDEFFLLYQPVLNVEKKKIDSLEALIRWKKKDGSVLGPGGFIPIAEQSDMIIRIGAWVIEESILQLQRWKKQGLDDISVAINLSARQFLNRDIVGYIKKTLSISGIHPDRFQVEVTESVAMRDIELTKKILQDLHESGVSVSLDDFGTGHSSLSYLKQFPISKLKIDQSFIRELPDDLESAAITSAMITLGQAIHLKIVVEGVETMEQLKFVEKENADYVQGYLISRPMESEKISEFIQKFDYACYSKD